MRRRWVLIAVLVVVVILGAGTALLLRSAPQAKGGQPDRAGSPPRAAITTIQKLTSTSVATQHSALTPELNSVLSPGRLFAAGTTFTPDPHGWHQSGAYANVTGTINQPGSPPVKAEIGLVLRRGHWFVTFEGQL